jgi:hypothetical protein
MGNGIYFKIAGWVDLSWYAAHFLLKIEHMVKLQVLGNNSKTVNNIKNLIWCKNDQHIKICLPCNFEVNLITHLTASPDTILKLDTLVMIQTKFGFHWSSTFRGEDFWKSWRRTTTTNAAYGKFRKWNSGTENDYFWFCR